jgi:hypothetical protein
MTRNIGLAITLILILASCSEPEQKDQPIGGAEINIPVDTTHSESVPKQELTLNLEKGETYIQNSSSNTTIFQIIGAQQASTGIAVNAQTSFKVLDISKGLFTMEVRYQHMIMSVVTPQEIKQYSTENSVPSDFVSMAMQNLKDKPFKIIMDRKGNVVEVKGIAALFEDAVKRFKGDNARKQAILNQLVQAFGEKSFISNIERCSAIFPSEPVGTGQRWTIANSTSGAMASNVITEFKLTAINDSICDITGNAKVSTDNKEALEVNGIVMKYNMSGTMTSNIKIDRKTGWIKKAQLKQNIGGNAQIRAGEQAQEVTVPMNLSSEVTISDK